MKICIDSGHGGSDTGAISGNRYEKADNLRLAIELQKQFAEQGISVVMTRTTDVYSDLPTRVKISDNNNCDLLISCHENSFTDLTSNGVEIWVHSQATSKIIKWAENIVNAFAKFGFALRSSNDVKLPKGVKRGYTGNINANYTINTCKAPSMLIELGFITNAKDMSLVDMYYKDCATAIVKSSLDYLGTTYKDVTTPPTIEEKQYYKINKTFNNGKWNVEQKGAFDFTAKGLEEAIKFYEDSNLSSEYFIFDPYGNIEYPNSHNSQLVDYETEMKKLKSENISLNKTIEELTKLNSKLTTQNNELFEIQNDMSAKIQNYQDEIQDYKDNNIRYKNIIAKVKEAVN